MTEKKTYMTKSGKQLTDAEVEALAGEVATTSYDLDAVTVRRGRPTLGAGPSELVAVRLDPKLFEALEQRAESDQDSDSEVIRKALREYLAS